MFSIGSEEISLSGEFREHYNLTCVDALHKLVKYADTWSLKCGRKTRKSTYYKSSFSGKKII